MQENWSRRPVIGGERVTGWGSEEEVRKVVGSQCFLSEIWNEWTWGAGEKRGCGYEQSCDRGV